MHDYGYFQIHPVNNELVKLVVDSCITAFDSKAFGPKVLNHIRFIQELFKVLFQHDFAQDQLPGSSLLDVPIAIPYVSAEFALRSSNPEDYICRFHDNAVRLFMKRQLALPVTECQIRLYSKDFYLSRPKIHASDKERVIKLNPDYIIVGIYTVVFEDHKDYVTVGD